MGDARRVKVADRSLRGGGVKEQLMLGKLDISLRWVDYSLRALLKCCLELYCASVAVPWKTRVIQIRYVQEE